MKREVAQQELKRTLGTLGPNIWVHLDEVSFPQRFGYGQEAVAEAEAFAKRERCIFIATADGRGGRFGRAYPRGA